MGKMGFCYSIKLHNSTQTSYTTYVSQLFGEGQLEYPECENPLGRPALACFALVLEAPRRLNFHVIHPAVKIGIRPRHPRNGLFQTAPYSRPHLVADIKARGKLHTPL